MSDTRIPIGCAGAGTRGAAIVPEDPGIIGERARGR